ncbi:hypothetical protein AAG906_019064 [Vitis piasezkii]
MISPCRSTNLQLSSLMKLMHWQLGKETTLNQLLIELDGFDTAKVLYFGCYKSYGFVGSALLRPEFDLDILKVHARKVKLAESVDLSTYAQNLPGWTGARLAQLLQEAALVAVRKGHEAILQSDVDEAVDRLTVGPKRVGIELGHQGQCRELLLKRYESAKLKRCDRISVIPRGQVFFLSFSSLLEGGRRCREESSSRRLRVWEEGGRKYRLECRSNVLSSFPEGKGLVGGWFILAQKLRALGITNQPMRNVEMGTSTFVKEDYRGKGKEKGKGVFRDAVRMETGVLGEALWVQVGERDLTARKSGRMKGGLSREKWKPPKGSVGESSRLPLHLWSREVFKSIERGARFIVVDEDTTFSPSSVKRRGGRSGMREGWIHANGSVRVVQNGKSELQARGRGSSLSLCGDLGPSNIPAEVEGDGTELMAVQVEDAVELMQRFGYYAGPSPLYGWGIGILLLFFFFFWGTAEVVEAWRVGFGAEGSWVFMRLEWEKAEPRRLEMEWTSAGLGVLKEERS